MNKSPKSSRILHSSIAALVAVPLLAAWAPRAQAVDRAWGTNLGAGPLSPDK